MIDYLIVIETYHVGIEVTITDCCDYSTIDWNGNTPITQAQLDDEWLDCYKDMYIETMSQQAQGDIVDGFQSSALGISYWYDSKAEDQLNLIGSAAAGDSAYYGCRDTQDGTKTYRLHTNARIVEVIQDGRDVKLSILQTFNSKKELILAAADQAAVDSIVW